MLLRYRTQKPKRKPFVNATFKEIAEILGCSTAWVHKACRERREALDMALSAKGTMRRPKAEPPMHYKWKRYHYTMEHQSWLTSPHVLRLQAHLSLAGRCARFHRQYPEMRISVNKIREIYKKHMVRRKVLQEQKMVTRPHLQRIDEEARRALQEFREYVRRGFNIVYLDEVCFTKTTLPTLCWSATHD